MVVAAIPGSRGAPASRALTAADVVDRPTLSRRSIELASVRTPPSELIHGRWYTRMLDGISRLRARFGADVVSVAYISPAAGLTEENEPLIPSSFSFSEIPRASVNALADFTGVPTAIRERTRDVPICIFLLPGAAIQAIRPPLPVGPGSKHVYLTTAGGATLLKGESVVSVRIGREHLREFEAGDIDIKGELFCRFAVAISNLTNGSAASLAGRLDEALFWEMVRVSPVK